jgi:maltose alpha-D-glucosyltransferase/alpha-amylase
MRRKKSRRLYRAAPETAAQQAKETYRELRKTLPELLVGYLAGQRWFGGKARQIRSTEIIDLVPLDSTRFETFVLLVHVDYAAGPGEKYLLPLICTREPTEESATTGLTVHSPERGIDLHLRNALADTEFLHSLIETFEQKAVFRGVEGEIHAEYERISRSLRRFHKCLATTANKGGTEQHLDYLWRSRDFEIFP